MKKNKPETNTCPYCKRTFPFGSVYFTTKHMGYLPRRFNLCLYCKECVALFEADYDVWLVFASTQSQRNV